MRVVSPWSMQRSQYSSDLEAAFGADYDGYRQMIIYQALRMKLGREPTDAEMKAEVERR